MIEGAIHTRRSVDAMGQETVVPTVPLTDACAPMLFASMTSSVLGLDDGPMEVGLLGATRGTSLLVTRAGQRLSATLGSLQLCTMPACLLSLRPLW